MQILQHELQSKDNECKEWSNKYQQLVSHCSSIEHELLFAHETVQQLQTNNGELLGERSLLISELQETKTKCDQLTVELLQLEEEYRGSETMLKEKILNLQQQCALIQREKEQTMQNYEQQIQMQQIAESQERGQVEDDWSILLQQLSVSLKPLQDSFNDLRGQKQQWVAFRNQIVENINIVIQSWHVLDQSHRELVSEMGQLRRKLMVMEEDIKTKDEHIHTLTQTCKLTTETSSKFTVLEASGSPSRQHDALKNQIQRLKVCLPILLIVLQERHSHHIHQPQTERL